MQRSLQRPEENSLVRYLRNRVFPADLVCCLVERYRIGTALKPWKGSPIFWQIDQSGRVRTGKIIPYNPETGKRIKEYRPSCCWAHTLLKESGDVKNFNLQQCLYGEHLIHNSETIAVAESEKTAIIASVYYPQYTWVATGGKAGLNAEKLQPLKGKRIILFPDKGCFNDWKKKGQQIERALNVPLDVSRLVETLPIPDGGDLADWLPGNAIIPDTWTTTERLPF